MSVGVGVRVTAQRSLKISPTLLFAASLTVACRAQSSAPAEKGPAMSASARNNPNTR